MAKKKKKKGTSRRRHRVSGVRVHPALKDAGMMALGAVAGGVASAFVNQAIKTSFPTMPAYIGGAVPVAAGLALPLFMKPTPVIMGLSGGLIGGGAIFAINETVLSLPGISGVPMGLTNAKPGYVNQVVSGYRGIPANRIGNLSGKSSAVISGLYEN